MVVDRKEKQEKLLDDDDDDAFLKYMYSFGINLFILIKEHQFTSCFSILLTMFKYCSGCEEIC